MIVSTRQCPTKCRSIDNDMKAPSGWTWVELTHRPLPPFRRGSAAATETLLQHSSLKSRKSEYINDWSQYEDRFTRLVRIMGCCIAWAKVLSGQAFTIASSLEGETRTLGSRVCSPVTAVETRWVNIAALYCCLVRSSSQAAGVGRPPRICS
jgi:hypothetical protein